MIRIILIIFIISAGINYYFSAKSYSGPISNHFDGKVFYNISSDDPRFAKESISKSSLFSFFIKKINSSWTEKSLPSEPTKPKDRLWGSDIEITYINHSTVLLQTEGLNIITDPVWAKRASPFSFLGPKRHMPVGVLMDDLPKIDIILLSHNHYDHMDIEALKKISKRDNSTIYTGLGNKKYLESRGVSNVFEMDWGDKKVYSDNLSVNAVPAQHFSSRGLTDRNKTLWLGFVLKTQNGDIYFAGDTGYGPFVDLIKKDYPEGFRLALLPIGAYEPRDFMKSMHTSPEDSLNMYKDLKVRNAIPVHFGTFDLALEGQETPVNELNRLLGLDENKGVNFKILWNSQTHTIK